MTPSADIWRGANDHDPAGRGDRQRRRQPDGARAREWRSTFICGRHRRDAIAADDTGARQTNTSRPRESSQAERAAGRHRPCRGFTCRGRVTAHADRRHRGPRHSITDGYNSTRYNNRWPVTSPSTVNGACTSACSNLGIDGNRVLLDGAGVSALAFLSTSWPLRRDACSSSRINDGHRRCSMTARVRRRPSSSPAIVS